MPGFVGGTGTAYPTSLSQIGAALETTKGTLMSEPAYMFPVKSPKYKPDLMYIPDETLQGSMVGIYDEVQGMRYDSHGWDAPPYLDSFPLLVCAELGSTDNYTVAGSATTLADAATAGATTITTAAAVAAGSVVILDSGNYAIQETVMVKSVASEVLTLAYQTIYAHAEGATVTPLNVHQFSLNNNAKQGQPPSCSLWDYDGEEWRTLTAAQMDELTIKGNATSLIEYTNTWFCNAATPNASAPSTSYTDITTPAPWTTTVLLGGTQVQTVVDWSYNFKRGVTAIPALTGSEAYLEYLANVLQCPAKLTFVEQSDSPYLTDYLTGVKQSLDVTFYDRYSGDLCNLHSSIALFTTGELDRTKPEVEVACDVQLLPSAADALAGGKSPVIITIGNGVSSSYYTD